MAKLERSVKDDILKQIGSRIDMMVENRMVGMAVPLNSTYPMMYGSKGEADLRVTWRRKFRVLYRNEKGSFHSFERVETKVIGQALAIETKRGKGGIQSADQKKWQRAWEAMGGIYILTNSVEDFFEQLNRVDLQDEYILAQ